MAGDLKNLQLSIKQNADTTENMLEINFESMQATLLNNMAQMMRNGGVAPPAAPQQQAAQAAEQLLQDSATATRAAHEDAQKNAISKLQLAHHRACAGWHARHMLTVPAVLLEAQEVLSARAERRMAAEEGTSQPFHLLPHHWRAKEFPWASTAWQQNLAPESVRPRVVRYL